MVFSGPPPDEMDNLDGLNDGEDRKPTPIPPAFGLAGINPHTWTSWGGVPHWNAFVPGLEMGGQGTFYDLRLRDASRFSVAAANGFDDARVSPDENQVTSKLPRSLATLADVVEHYDLHFSLGLTDEERSDLVQFLLSLQAVLTRSRRSMFKAWVAPEALIDATREARRATGHRRLRADTPLEAALGSG